MSGADDVWDVLIEHAGARSDGDARDEFRFHWPECREFRFMGALGIGGKVYAERPPKPPRVSCYPEDRTTERDAIIAATNAALAALTAEASR